MIKTEWLAIVNMAANGGKTRKKWHKKITKALADAEIVYDVVETAYEGHGIVLTTDAIKKGYRKLIVVGGDGTYNEVVNGVMLQQQTASTNITLAMIPGGTGNDWAKTMKIPINIKKAVAIIKNGIPYVQDVGLASYHKGDKQYQRYFWNVGGTGFDAYVGQRLTKKRFGRMTYLIELVLGLFGYKNVPVRINSQEKQSEEKVFMMAAALCKYFGDGMMIAPTAVPNNGQLDITLIKDLSKLGVMRELTRLYNGKFLKNKKVETFGTKKIDIESDEAIYLQLDGEVVGHGPVTFELVPQSIKVLVNKDFEI